MNLVNKNMAMEYLMGNEIIYDKIKKSFLNSYQNHKDKYQEFKENENIKEAYSYIHSIKGISLNFLIVHRFFIASYKSIINLILIIYFISL